MQAVNTHHPPGHVGIITADLSRYPEFWLSTIRTLVPANSTYSHIRGNGFATNRNEIVRDMIKINPDAQWLWFIDDDHSFPAECIMRLLDRNVDIIQPIISTRKPPYRPYGYMFRDGEFWSIKWGDIPTDGKPMKVDAVGAGGTLIRRKVLDALRDPWFEEGKTYADSIGEDLTFCRKAQLAGFQCWLDTSMPIGHMTTEEVWPVVVDGKWMIDLDQYHGVRVRVPPNICMPKEVV